MTLSDTLSSITAGESVSILISYIDYPRSEGWELSISLGGDGWTDSFNCLSGSGTDDFLLSIPYADTETWKAGNAVFSVWATNGTNRKLVEQGTFIVYGNPSTPSYNQTVLTAIRALISGRATDDQRTVNLEGIALQYMTPTELLKWETVFASRVQSEFRSLSRGKLRQSIRYVLPV